MVGTGAFAVWQPALSRAGSWLLFSLLIAAIVAALNAISTARLARVHPEAGGAYAYGRIRVSRGAGILAGVVFTLGKSASAAAAALTIGLYVWPQQQKIVAAAAILLALVIDLRGITKTVRVTAVLSAVVIGALLVVLVVTFAGVSEPLGASMSLSPETGLLGVLTAAGLIFVAFAGYARVTVLGEEVKRPERTIPRAMVLSFLIVGILYALIGSGVMLAAKAGIAIEAAAIESLAAAFGGEWLRVVVVIAAVLAAGAVLLSLLTGVGRTLFAMASSGDAPRALAAVGKTVHVPWRAEIVAAFLAAALVLVGSLPFALAMSAALILTYYCVAHVAAWRLPSNSLFLGRWIPLLGILGSGAIAIALIVAPWTASRG
jgi:APA family basic amino acid/polyamine antiporter